ASAASSAAGSDGGQDGDDGKCGDASHEGATLTPRPAIVGPVRVGRREVSFSNPDKVFFPDKGLTKGDLVRYYLDVADCVLNHVSNRPMQMLRYPDGVEGFRFYQKRVPVPHPDWLETVHIRFPRGGTADFPVCNSAAALAWIVNLGCIDLHAWH